MENHPLKNPESVRCLCLLRAKEFPKPHSQILTTWVLALDWREEAIVRRTSPGLQVGWIIYTSRFAGQAKGEITAESMLTDRSSSYMGLAHGKLKH